jgi:hypothetical protein
VLSTMYPFTSDFVGSELVVAGQLLLGRRIDDRDCASSRLRHGRLHFVCTDQRSLNVWCSFASGCLGLSSLAGFLGFHGKYGARCVEEDALCRAAHDEFS